MECISHRQCSTVGTLIGICSGSGYCSCGMFNRDWMLSGAIQGPVMNTVPMIYIAWVASTSDPPLGQKRNWRLKYRLN